MNPDYGMKISLPGQNVLSTLPSNIVFNTKNPFIKIDTQKSTGFQTIMLSFINDPPEILTGGDTYTTIFKFAHGYDYAPSIETLFYVSVAPPNGAFYQNYFLDSGIIASQGFTATAYLYSIYDSKNIYFIVHKFNLGFGANTQLTGAVVEITVNVFVDDLSGQ